MGKFHTITAVIAWIFIIVLLFVLVHPFSLSDGLEKTYRANEGLIWVIGIAGIATANLFLFLNGIVQRENKKCVQENVKKNNVIEQQNNTIIKNQVRYIEGQENLSKAIYENTRKDLETIKIIQQHENKLERMEETIITLEKSIIEFEKYNGKSDKRLEAIEKLLKLHDGIITKLSKK